MKALLYPTLSLLVIFLISSSCVSNRAYLVLQGRAEQAQKDNLTLHQHIQQLEDTVRLVENKLGVCDNANELLLVC
jgi:hypothetical protein